MTNDTPRRLTTAELPAAARTLGRALLDDPGWVHVFPDDPPRAARMETMLRLGLRHIYHRHDECWAIGEGAECAGAALWEPPGGHDVPLLRALRVAPRFAWLIRRRLRAGLDVVREMERRHPKEPHWYLAILGIDPSHQGKGLGARLLAPVLDRADADRTPCWLESANPRNHGFYRRLGFEVADTHRFSDAFEMTFFARRPR